MDNFYNDIKKYGTVILGSYLEVKPKPVDIDSSIDYGLYWINSVSYFDKIPPKSTVIMSTETFNILLNDGLVNNDNTIISCDSPRKTYSNVLNDLYSHLFLDADLILLNNSNLIGYNVLMGDNVVMGINVKIGNNVVIYNNTIIGDNVNIGDNVVIGSKGVAYDEESDGTLTKFPQIGGTILGDDIEIGNFCDIKRGALKDTVISNGVKLGAYNSVGHNVYIGENCFISARCTICGSAKIGKNSVLWVNSTIKHKITVPNRTTIGSNTYVDKSFVGDGLLLIGIPAKIK